MRVGELVALKWSDISKGTIHIQRQEVIYDVYDDDLNKTKSSVHEVVEYTKTQAGERILPLTPEAKRILDKIKEWNKIHKLKSDFIFVNASNHNFNRQRINTCLYSYCKKVDIIKKSSHTIRRSVISVYWITSPIKRRCRNLQDMKTLKQLSTLIIKILVMMMI